MKIALIAHDKKKDDIIELSKRYKSVLAEHELFATGTTGTLIMGETALPIHRMKSGPLGGDQQIGAMLANGEIGLIIFLRDPLTAQPDNDRQKDGSQHWTNIGSDGNNAAQTHDDDGHGGHHAADSNRFRIILSHKLPLCFNRPYLISHSF